MSTDSENWSHIASAIDPHGIGRRFSLWTVEALLGLDALQSVRCEMAREEQILLPPWDDTGESLIAQSEWSDAE